MELLNNNPKNWFDHAEGFMEAFTIIYNEWDTWERRVNFNYKTLLIPQSFLFVHSSELYLKCFLVSKGESPSHLYTHDLSILRKKCAKYDDFFNEKDITYLDYAAGAAKNYTGKKYPEGGASTSFHNLIILKKLHFHICTELKYFERL